MGYYRLLKRIEEMEKHIMSGLTDLQANVTALTNMVTSIQTAFATLNTEVANLTAQLAAQVVGDPDADVETAAQQVAAATASLGAIINPPTPSDT